MTREQIDKYVTLHVDTFHGDGGYEVLVNGNRAIPGLKRDQVIAINEAIRHAVGSALTTKMAEIREVLGVRS